MESKQINNQKQVVNYEAVNNTPFTIVEKDSKFYVVLGDTAVCKEAFKKRRSAQRYIKKITWENLTNVICIIAKKIIDYEKENNFNNNNNSAND